MAVGQVGFKDPKKVNWRQPPSSRTLAHTGAQVKKIHVEQRENPIVNRLNKTKVEKYPNLRQERDDRMNELRKRDRAAQQARVGGPLTCSVKGRIS